MLLGAMHLHRQSPIQLESNSLELSLHIPSSMNYYPPIPSTSNNDSHLKLSRDHSNKIQDPQFSEPSGNRTTDSNNESNMTDNNEHNWFNWDMTLNYINNLVMQEDSNDEVKLHHEESALRAMEEPFYKLLGHNHPSYPHQMQLLSCDYLKNLDASTSRSRLEPYSRCSVDVDPIDSHSNDNSTGKSRLEPCSRCSVAIDSIDSHSNENFESFEAPWSLSAVVGEKNTQDTYRMDLGFNIGDLSIAQKPSTEDLFVQVHNRDTNNDALIEVQCREDNDLLEGRSKKQIAISYDEPIRDEMFDKVLLYSLHKPLEGATVLQGTAATKSKDNSQNNQGRTSFRQKIRGKKQLKEEVGDLRTLLIHCAEAVSVNNHTMARDLLKKIRQHSSASGDDSQRLAFCLADCLEIRLTGIAGHIYHNLISRRSNARDTLKVFHLMLPVSPSIKALYNFSNKTILDVSIGKSQVHIIDFGIGFGFQWPSLFEQLGKREDGPPIIRITGIDVPQPGFRPNQMNKNTGQRLAEYAHMFNVPFKYQGISSKWENIRVEDFNIQNDEVLIVNCIHKMQNLGDETVSINSARNRVLRNIRLLKPNVFILGVLNGSYSTPFFLTRFKEVMYYYTAIFDMLDKTLPSDSEERMITEREFLLPILINVIACEGSERIERPETYKKWGARNLKAGFEQLPLNPGIARGTKDMVKQLYHKDFVVSEDEQWLLLGWKGRILYAISTWKPNESNDGD